MKRDRRMRYLAMNRTLLIKILLWVLIVTLIIMANMIWKNQKKTSKKMNTSTRQHLQSSAMIPCINSCSKQIRKLTIDHIKNKCIKPNSKTSCSKVIILILVRNSGIKKVISIQKIGSWVTWWIILQISHYKFKLKCKQPQIHQLQC